MEDRQKEAVSVLNHLIEICEDGYQGYRQAAEHVEDASLRQLFGRYSQQRAQFAAELRNEVLRLGGDPSDGDGTVGGAFLRGWANIKAAFSTDDIESAIHECESQEDRTIDEYRSALDNELPTNIRSVVEKQYVGVKEAHDHMRSLEIRSDDDRAS